MNPGDRVKVKSLDREKWNRAAADNLEGQSGIVERVKADYGFGEGPHALVAFDPPLPPWHTHAMPCTGHWFSLDELEITT